MMLPSCTRWFWLLLMPPLVFAGMAASVPEPTVPPISAAYPDHLDGAYTGGFGEPTCQACHFDYEVNNDRGLVTLQNLDDTYEPGASYELKVRVESDHLRNGGFQLTARHPDGSQAGRFFWDGDRVTLTPTISDEVTYVQHAEGGTAPTNERSVSWNLTWKAPASESPVIFNVAGNAGNADDSAFGDFIYVEEIQLKPAK